MLFISAEEHKRLNRLVRYAVKRERKILLGRKTIFDVGKRFRCQLQAVSEDGGEDTSYNKCSVRFIALPYELQTKEVVCKIECHGGLQSSSEKAEVILELLKNRVDYAVLFKKFQLQDTDDIKDYVSMRILLGLFVKKGNGVKIASG